MHRSERAVRDGCFRRLFQNEKLAVVYNLEDPNCGAPPG